LDKQATTGVEYTPWAIKKRATLFGIITPMFRGGFLHFVHQSKEEKYSIGELQNLQL